MTVKKAPDGHYIRLDLHLGKDEFEITEFVPKDFDDVLLSAAGPYPMMNMLERYEAELQKDGADSQSGLGSPLFECFRAAMRHAEASFGLQSEAISADRLVSGYGESPTAHPLQRYAHYRR